jgi:predicted CoA-binding protein
MNESPNEPISLFLSGTPFAVVGASSSREKYGNQVLRSYWRAGRVAFPVNPTATVVEGAPCFPNLSALPERPHGVSIITPPHVSAEVVDEALSLGIEYLWFQPGAEHDGAIAKALAAGCTVIAHGPCVLVLLRRE